LQGDFHPDELAWDGGYIFGGAIETDFAAGSQSTMPTDSTCPPPRTAEHLTMTPAAQLLDRKWYGSTPPTLGTSPQTIRNNAPMVTKHGGSSTPCHRDQADVLALNDVVGSATKSCPQQLTPIPRRHTGRAPEISLIRRSRPAPPLVIPATSAHGFQSPKMIAIKQKPDDRWRRKFEPVFSAGWASAKAADLNHDPPCTPN